MGKTKVWAHRGASGYVPENTMEAFELAVRQNADGIELDVQISEDGRLVVMHDETIDRVTNGKGAVREYTVEQLKELQVQTPDTKQGIYRIPLLEEVLDLMKKTDMRVNIELKNSIYLYQQMEEKVLELVKEMQMEDQVIYSSFNHYSLQKIRALAPDALTGLLFGDGLVHPAAYAKGLGVTALHPAVYHLQYPDFVKECRDAGLCMHVWTVNLPEHMEMVKEAGAEAVITNYPDRALKICRES